MISIKTVMTSITTDMFNDLNISHYPMKVSPSFAGRMQLSNDKDPLLLQVLPQPAELDIKVGYSSDPLGESGYSPIPGVLHKYHGRVLLLLTLDCPIHCRFCFRRHRYGHSSGCSHGRHYALDTLAERDLSRVYDYVENDASVREVILSGGEPLLWEDAKLGQLLARLTAISHVKRIRIHSRMPIVAPQRITAELSVMLQQLPVPVVFVTHCNHAQEIDAEVQEALARLHIGAAEVAQTFNASNARGVANISNATLLNQTVLLKGINDSVEVLAALSERLFAVGVLPYYLHLLDKVQGAAHFEVDDEVAKDLLRQLMQRLPGYLVPRLVRDGSGENLAKQHVIS